MHRNHSDVAEDEYFESDSIKIQRNDTTNMSSEEIRVCKSHRKVMVQNPDSTVYSSTKKLLTTQKVLAK